MILRPRDYQEAAHESIYEYFRTHTTGNPLVAMPTGTGKAIVIAMLIERALKWYPGTKILCLTHVKELIKQNFDKLKWLWPHAPAGLYSAGLKKEEHHYPITFAGIRSIFRRSQLFGHIDLILIDEAHLVSDADSAMYVEFLAKMKIINPRLRVIGLTATKWRTGMGLLTNGKIFDDVCFDLTSLEAFNWLLNEGYLKPLIPQPMEMQFDLKGVQTSNTGDYNLGQLQDAVDQTELNHRAIRQIMEKGADRKHWLLFASGVEHALHLGEILDGLGVPVAVVHSRMADGERDANIAGFLSGKYRAIVNNGILTTGFDYPEIDLIAVLRPTKSSSLWVQMLGRGTRPVYAGGYDLGTRDGRLAAIYYGGAPNCLVLDFARNTIRLGPINEPVIPKQKGAGGGGGEAPVKECPACGTYVHASVTVCPYCHAEIPRYLKITDEAGTAELIKQVETQPPPPVQPVVEEFDVHKVTYQLHQKEGKPDSMKVVYYVGKYARYQEWVCFEHEKIKGKARNWWRQRTPIPPPETTEEALEMAQALAVPTTIKVRTDTHFKEIIGYGNIVRPES